jgi:hypothetical protein
MRVVAAQVVDVQVTSAWFAKPWKNSCARSTSKVPIMRA